MPQTGEGPLILSDQLRRRISNEKNAFEGGKPPQELAFTIHNFVVIYYHMLLRLIEAHNISRIQTADPRICSPALCHLS